MRFLAAVTLMCLAGPSFAQSADPLVAQGYTPEKMKELRSKFQRLSAQGSSGAPLFDRRPELAIQRLISKLETEASKVGGTNVFSRTGPLNASGRKDDVSATLVSGGSSAAEDTRDLARNFSHILVVEEVWAIDAKTGAGQKDVWEFEVS